MQNLKPKTSSKRKPAKQRALMPPDETYSGPVVADSMWFPQVTKQIEQVGEGYEALKHRYARLHERMEKGASA